MEEEVSSYRVQWKGVVSGPYARGELQDMLAHGQISLVHRVEVNGKWKGIQEFLNPVAPRLNSKTVAEAEAPATEMVGLQSGGAMSETVGLRPHLNMRVLGESGQTAEAVGQEQIEGEAGVSAGVAFAPLGSGDVVVPAAAFDAGARAGGAFAEEGRPKTSAGAEAAELERILCLGHILCGICFVLPFLATIPALGVAFWLQARGALKSARQLFILSGALTILGVVFWIVAKWMW
jgi:hypothetical protein